MPANMGIFKSSTLLAEITCKHTYTLYHSRFNPSSRLLFLWILLGSRCSIGILLYKNALPLQLRAPKKNPVHHLALSFTIPQRVAETVVCSRVTKLQA